MFKNFRLGVGSYLVAHRFIVRHKLYWFFLFPIALNILLLVVFFGIYDGLHDIVYHWVSQKFAETLQGYDKAVDIGTQIIISVLLIIGYIYVYRTILLTLLSPFLAWFSEKIDSLYTGRDFPFNFKQLMIDAFRGMRLSIRNLFLEMILVFGLMLLGLIPIFSIFIPFLIFLVQSFYMGFAMMDYTNERKKIPYKERKKYMKRNRPVVLGIGSVFMLLFIIPVLGWVLAPVYGAVAGTLAVLQNDQMKAPYIEDKDNNILK
jgi:CysZ protein